MFRCNEVVTNVKNLVLAKDYVTEGKIPELTSKKIEMPGRALGVVRGCGFMGDFMSDNGRWYPGKLWENVVNAEYVQDMLHDKLMFGTCGHPNTPGDEHPIVVDYLTDWEMGKGIYSHCMTDIDYSEAPTGIIEYVIMDTDWGKNLYAILSIGSKLSVSSRAMADYIPGEYHDGQPVMDPDNFLLDTFDVVRIPGIAPATPGLVQLKESIDRKIKQAENKASKIYVPVSKSNDYSSLLW